jgi:RND family efflux transporter MFP subunit
VNKPGIHASEAAPDPSQSGTALAYLDQALWKRFHEASSTEEFASAWLTLQCSMLNGVRAGVIVLGGPDEDAFVPVAAWPSDIRPSGDLSNAAEAAIEARKGIVNKSEDSACAAYPIVMDGTLRGVAAVELSIAADAALRATMRQLQWGCGWLEANLRKPDTGVAIRSSGDAALAIELTALVLEAEHFQQAATAVVTELATRLSCERVALGIRLKKHTRVVALSHSAQFGKSSNLTHAIGLAMDEAIDQYGPLVYPQLEGQSVRVDKAHADLAEISGDRNICSVPIADAGELFGAMTLDVSASMPFDSERLQSIVRIATFLGPVLAVKHREDRWIGRKVYDSLMTQLGRFMGPRYVGRKLIAAAVLALVLFLTFATDTYRVQAAATLEGAIERVAVAPIAGYIIEANVRAGDRVTEGDPLFRIDDRDLRLEFLKWSSQKEQIQRQQRDALAQHERSEVNILRAQLDQADSQLRLISEQIARTRASAPFDGIVVSGDLSDKLGAPVERGEILFTIAPFNEYRVALQVSENEISEVEVGQTGQLVLAANPDELLSIRIEAITPVSTVADGKNTFRLEASLEGTPEFLRPGMQGAARIEIEDRSVGWIWTHELVQWLKLWFWSWWP